MKLTFTLTAICFSFLATAQEFPGTFNTFNEPYVELEGGTSVTGTDAWDDPEVNVPIGFDFTLFGETFSSLEFVGVGGQLMSGFATSVQVMMPYGSDIINASTTELVSPITYLTEGEPGARIFKMQWSNVGFYYELEANDSFNNITNFQLWLYEGTNVIEYRYGSNTIKESTLVHDFGRPLVAIVRNANLFDFSWESFWTLAGNPTDPTMVSHPSGDFEFSQNELLNFEPPTGTVYQFNASEVVESTTELDGKNKATLWPTIATNDIQISNVNGTYQIYNGVGQLIHTDKTQEDAIETINVSAWSAGHYIVKLEDGQTLKFLVPGS
jgi:hypothetical protein